MVTKIYIGAIAVAALCASPFAIVVIPDLWRQATHRHHTATLDLETGDTVYRFFGYEYKHFSPDPDTRDFIFASSIPLEKDVRYRDYTAGYNPEKRYPDYRNLNGDRYVLIRIARWRSIDAALAAVAIRMYQRHLLFGAEYEALGDLLLPAIHDEPLHPSGSELAEIRKKVQEAVTADPDLVPAP